MKILGYEFITQAVKYCGIGARGVSPWPHVCMFESTVSIIPIIDILILPKSACVLLRCRSLKAQVRREPISRSQFPLRNGNRRYWLDSKIPQHSVAEPLAKRHCKKVYNELRKGIEFLSIFIQIWCVSGVWNSDFNL